MKHLGVIDQSSCIGLKRKLALALAGLICFAAVSANESAEPPTCKYCPDVTGWKSALGVTLGYQNQDDVVLGRFSGQADEGSYLNLSLDSSLIDEDGWGLQIEAQGLGSDAPYVQVLGGQQGYVEFGFTFEQIPNRRDSSGSSVYSDRGSALQLPANWQSGLTTQEMPALDASLKPITLGTERERSEVIASFFPAPRWQFSLSVQRDEKQGIRDIGATIGFNQTVILPQPIDYVTDDITLSLGYSDADFQAELRVLDSNFSNRRYAVTWQNPFEDASSDTAYGRLGLDSPDNEMRQLSALLGYKINASTRVSGKFMRGKLTQNDSLLPYTINPATTTSALPQTSANAEVDTRLASIRLITEPIDNLTLDANLSRSQRDNKTPIHTYQVVSTDLATGGSRNNRPYSFEQGIMSLNGRYRFDSGMKLSATVQNDAMQRSYTSVEETDEDSVTLKLDLPTFGGLDSTVQLSRANRQASPFRPLSDIDPLYDYPDSNFYNNPLLRMINLSDRQRDSMGLELSYLTASAMAISGNLNRHQDDYDEQYLGLQQAEGWDATVSLAWTTEEQFSTALFVTADRLDSSQKGSERLLPSDAGSTWIASEENRTGSAGVDFSWPMFENQLLMNTSLSYSRFRGTIRYSSGDDLPELGSRLSTANISGDYRVDEDVSVRFEVRHEIYQETDWAKDSRVNAIPGLLSLGLAPQDLATTAAFVTLYYRF